MGLDFQALERIAAPATEPLSLSEVKDHLAVDGTERDTMLTQMIVAATSFVDGLGILGGALITQTWGQWVSGSPSEVVLKMLPVQSLSAVKYYDTAGVLQTATLSDFELQAAGEWAMVKPITGKTWPTTDDRLAPIRVDYVAGYGAASDVPDDIKQALLMLVAHWFENRESTTDIRLASTPFGFNEILSNYRVSWYG